ncbi:MAG: sulfurtransferase-like selenium metabolism protein YedF [Deltaproteobacteria bacterium]|nr:sulfurtransferase-like selenium metabolism protein YedF [Deltaproteobacteria bacterium]
MTESAELIDCRGLACPEPVLRTKQALDGVAEGVVAVRVDSAASRDNVRRFAESQGAAVAVEDEPGGGWVLRIAKGFRCDMPGPAPATAVDLPTALLVTTDAIGPEPELGRILMRAFLGALGKASTLPAKVLFLNRGVFLTTGGSDVLDILRELEVAGVTVLSCGTCLEFFRKRDDLAVGQVSNMYETVETLTGRYRVVTLS